MNEWMNEWMNENENDIERDRNGARKLLQKFEFDVNVTYNTATVDLNHISYLNSQKTIRSSHVRVNLG